MTPVTLNPAPTKGTNPVPSAVTGFHGGDPPRPPALGAVPPGEDVRERREGGPARLLPGHRRGPALHRLDLRGAVDGKPRAPSGSRRGTGSRSSTGSTTRFRRTTAGSGSTRPPPTSTTRTPPPSRTGDRLHFYDAGLFKDFHYPNVRAGFAKTHPETSWNGRTVPGDVRETLSFCWFHDHRFDFTAQNTYKGLVSFYTLFSDDINLDTDDETTGLRLPSGEYDIPMIFADKVFDPRTGQLFFDLFNLDGILGDKYTVNGVIQPYLEVKRRKYRFRFLVGGPSRVYEFFLSNGQSFIQISNDGNLLPRPLIRRSIRLGVAERVDVIVDFSKAALGEKIYLQNRLEQRDGRAPTGKIIAPTNLVEFRVVGDAQDDSRVPVTLLDLPNRNVPIAKNGTWKFDRSNGAWTVNGRLFDPDVIQRHHQAEHRRDLDLQVGRRLATPDPYPPGGVPDPVPGREGPAHRGDRPEGRGADRRRRGREPTTRARYGSSMQFRDWLGDYPMHCHNTVHEDHAMMIRFKVVP